mgnify:CR=1 FL=1
MKEVHENKKAVIQFKDVVRTYGEGEAVQYAVNHVDFTIYEGEFAVILGQSGAGKSTVLNMLGGMDQPTTGQVVIDGEDVSAMNERQLSDFRAVSVPIPGCEVKLEFGYVTLADVPISGIGEEFLKEVRERLERGQDV